MPSASSFASTAGVAMPGVHAGHLLSHFDGRDYLRHDRHWYDAKSRMALPAIEENRLELLLRNTPGFVESAREAEARECLERHRERIASLGVSYRGAGPSRGWINRLAHCWAYKHPIDSAVDLQMLHVRMDYLPLRGMRLRLLRVGLSRGREAVGEMTALSNAAIWITVDSAATVAGSSC
jgi:hypothetical protein